MNIRAAEIGEHLFDLICHRTAADLEVQKEQHAALFGQSKVAVQRFVVDVLEVQTVVGGTPPLGTSFEILTAASVTGEFDTLIAPRLCCSRVWLVVYEESVVRLEVHVFPPGDLDHNFVVNVLDLIIMLLDFGDCPPACPSDLNGDGTVDRLDLIILLDNFG